MRFSRKTAFYKRCKKPSSVYPVQYYTSVVPNKFAQMLLVLTWNIALAYIVQYVHCTISCTIIILLYIIILYYCTIEKFSWFLKKRFFLSHTFVSVMLLKKLKCCKSGGLTLTLNFYIHPEIQHIVLRIILQRAS